MPWRNKAVKVLTDGNTNNYDTMVDLISLKNRSSIVNLEFNIDSNNFTNDYCCFLYLKKNLTDGTYTSSINFYKFAFSSNSDTNYFPRAINLEPDDILQFKYNGNTSHCEILIFMNYYECIGAHCNQDVTNRQEC